MSDCWCMNAPCSCKHNEPQEAAPPEVPAPDEVWVVVEGLLRRMLERDGFQPTFDWCKDVMRAFLDKKV